MDQAAKISLIESARQVLRRRADVTADDPNAGSYAHVGRPKNLIEAYMALRFPRSGPAIRYSVLVRRHVTAAVARNIAALAHRSAAKSPFLLVAERINPDAADSLKTLGLQYVDCSGSIYLFSEEPYAYIHLTGRRSPRLRAEKVVRAFQPAGLRVIFTLLSLYSERNSSYRTIAMYSGVALGTVVNTMEDLEKLGYIRSNRGKRILDIDKEDELIDRWVEGYLQRLRPKLGIQRFRTRNLDWWREFGMEEYKHFDLWLGGEPAAAVLMKYLRPGRITVYGRPNLDEFARRVKLSRDDDGELELLQPFWDFEGAPIQDKYDGKRLCPPLLIYADLVGAGDARCLDAAGMLREEFL